jgi:hypothetical protein
MFIAILVSLPVWSTSPYTNPLDAITVFAHIVFSSDSPASTLSPFSVYLYTPLKSYMASDGGSATTQASMLIRSRKSVL